MTKKNIRFSLLLQIGVILFLYYPNKGIAQELPPRPISVELSQMLNFGALTTGNMGGTVTITASGLRTSTGDVILITMGYIYNPAIFLIEGNPGTIVHILNGPDALMTGSNGGFLIVQLGETLPGSPVILQVAPPAQTMLYLGGILIVGDPLSNPSGLYSGTVELMFIQE